MIYKNYIKYFITSCLLYGLSGSYPALAFDLGGQLKEAVKKEISQAAPSDTSATATTPTDAKAQEKGSAAPADTINLARPSEQDEMRLGREIAGNLLGAAALVKDDALQRYVNQVGRWVASQSERPGLVWHFGVIESSDINAFAAPGGYILLTSGLYRTLENEAQLAGVLGHEIAHVVKKHHLKVLQKSQLLNLGANFLSDKLGKGNPSMQKVVGNGAEILARGLDKEAEFEADRMGMVLAARAGYDPYGLADVLARIAETSADSDSIALLYKTHPSADARLEQLAGTSTTGLDKIKNAKTSTKRFYRLN